MNGKLMIIVDEQEQRLIIDSLNDRRNSLVENGLNTSFIDKMLMTVIKAPQAKEKKHDRGGR